MPKYMLHASYTGTGLQSLQKDKASGRGDAFKRAVEALGGKVEALYWAFGEHDVVAIVDLPDNLAASALAVSATATGHLRVATTPLLTAAEVDQALLKTIKYGPAGG